MCGSDQQRGDRTCGEPIPGGGTVNVCYVLYLNNYPMNDRVIGRWVGFGYMDQTCAFMFADLENWLETRNEPTGAEPLGQELCFHPKSHAA